MVETIDSVMVDKESRCRLFCARGIDCLKSDKCKTCTCSGGIYCILCKGRKTLRFVSRIGWIMSKNNGASVKAKCGVACKCMDVCEVARSRTGIVFMTFLCTLACHRGGYVG